MKILTTFLFAILLSGNIFGAEVQNESNHLFTIDQNILHQEIGQVGTTFYKKNADDFFSNDSFAYFDLLDLNRFASQGHYMMAGKLAYIVDHPISFFTKDRFESEAYLKSTVKGLKNVAKNPADGKVTLTKKGKKLMISMTLIYQFFTESYEGAELDSDPFLQGMVSEFDPELGRPDKVFVQRYDAFSNIFNGVTSIARYHDLGKGKTLVVNYQVLSFNRKFANRIDGIPFTNTKNVFPKEFAGEYKYFLGKLRGL